MMDNTEASSGASGNRLQEHDLVQVQEVLRDVSSEIGDKKLRTLQEQMLCTVIHIYDNEHHEQVVELELSDVKGDPPLFTVIVGVDAVLKKVSTSPLDRKPSLSQPVASLFQGACDGIIPAWSEEHKKEVAGFASYVRKLHFQFPSCIRIGGVGNRKLLDDISRITYCVLEAAKSGPLALIGLRIPGNKQDLYESQLRVTLAKCLFTMLAPVPNKSYRSTKSSRLLGVVENLQPWAAIPVAPCSLHRFQQKDREENQTGANLVEAFGAPLHTAFHLSAGRTYLYPAMVEVTLTELIVPNTARELKHLRSIHDEKEDVEEWKVFGVGDPYEEGFKNAVIRKPYQWQRAWELYPDMSQVDILNFERTGTQDDIPCFQPASEQGERDPQSKAPEKLFEYLGDDVLKIM